MKIHYVIYFCQNKKIEIEYEPKILWYINPNIVLKITKITVLTASGIISLFLLLTKHIIKMSPFSDLLCLLVAISLPMKHVYDYFCYLEKFDLSILSVHQSDCVLQSQPQQRHWCQEPC